MKQIARETFNQKKSYKRQVRKCHKKMTHVIVAYIKNIPVICNLPQKNNKKDLDFIL